MAEKIGDASCPLCKAGTARVSLSKSGLAVLTCNACNCQLFTRSGRSDELVRARIKPASAPEPAAAPAPPTVPVAPAVAQPAPAPAPIPARKGIGMFPSWTR